MTKERSPGDLLWEQFLLSQKPKYYEDLKINEKAALLKVPTSHPIVECAFNDFINWLSDEIDKREHGND